MDWEIVYRDLKKLNWVILFILSSISYSIMDHSLTLGIILGGLAIIANFSVLQHTICGAFSIKGVMVKRKMSIIAKYYFRLLALAVIMFFLITKGWVDPVGLAVGLSTVVISIVSLGITRAWKTYSGEATY